MLLKFDHYDLASSEVSHDGFWRGHSSWVNKDLKVGFLKRIS
jgi:hypothetical protein